MITPVRGCVKVIAQALRNLSESLNIFHFCVLNYRYIRQAKIHKVHDTYPGLTFYYEVFNNTGEFYVWGTGAVQNVVCLLTNGNLLQQKVWFSSNIDFCIK